MPPSLRVMITVAERGRALPPSGHRITHRADAAAFLKDLAAVIENNPQSLTL